MNTIKLKNLIGKCWPAYNGHRKIILLYHSVGSHHTWAVSRKLFKMQMDWLYDHCNIVIVDDLVHSTKNEGINVAITFDDGYSSVYDHALPILDNKKKTALVYVNTRWISDKRKMSDHSLGYYPNEYFITWDEAKILSNQGWKIGSHTVNHVDMSKIKLQKLIMELEDSKVNIELNTQVDCLHFAYPWGKYNKIALEEVRKCGYKYAVSTRHGAISDLPNLFELPRINISSYYSFSNFKDIILGKWDYLSTYHNIKRYTEIIRRIYQ